MESDGVGKIKSKKSKEAIKPYDRPKTLLGKVGSTLIDLLTPSWYRTSSWQTTSETAVDVDEDEVEREAVTTQTEDSETATGYESRTQPMESARSSVQSTQDGVLVECEGYHATFHPSVLRDQVQPPFESSPSARPPLQSFYSPPGAYPGRQSASTSGSAGLFPPGRQSASTSGSASLFPPNYPTFGKRGAPQASGDDISYEAGDVSREEKAGTPVKKLCTEKNNLRTSFAESPSAAQSPLSRRSAAGEHSFLWKTKSNRSSASGSDPASRATTAASVTKPRFDTATFCSTFNHSQSETSSLNSSYKESPFYSGKTTYGGASAQTKRNRGSDYQVVSSVQPKVKVRQNTVTSTQVALSATARAILQGMEKSESQLSNDQAISSSMSSLYDSPLSFTPSSTTFKRNSLQTSGSHPSFKAGPPVRELMTPTSAIIAQNIHAYQGRVKDGKEAARSGSEMVVKNTPGSSSASHSTSYDLPSNVRSNEAPGKMRREQTRSHYSNRTTLNTDEMPKNVELPAIGLPPVTNFHPFATSSFSKSTSRSDGRQAAPSSNTATFTFSAPLNTSRDVEMTEEARPKSFQFRSPIAVEECKNKEVTTATSMSWTSLPTSEPVKSSLALNYNLDAAVKKPKPFTETVSVGLGGAAAELKRGSVMDILGQSSNSSSTSNMPSLASMFQKPPGEWTCPTCFVQNKEQNLKCCSCEEPKPVAKQPPSAGIKPVSSVSSENKMETDVAQSSSSTSAQTLLPVTGSAKPLTELFKPSSDTWACPVCFVRNSSSCAECPCCSTKRPEGSAAQPIANSLSSTKSKELLGKLESTQNIEIPNTSGLPSLASMFQKPAGEWTCPTCFVQNKDQNLKCCSCEEPKPGAKQPPAANGNGSTFSSASTTASAASNLDGQGGFKFNTSAFGSNSSSSNSSGQPVFKIPSNTSVSGVAPTGGFKMELPTSTFTGFGSAGFSGTKSSNDKQEPTGLPGGFKPPSDITFGQTQNTFVNGQSGTGGFSFPKPASEKQESSTAAGGFSAPGYSFGQTAAVSQTGKSEPVFGSARTSTSKTSLSSGSQQSTAGTNAGDGGFQVKTAEKSGSKDVKDDSLLMRPPLRVAETDKRDEKLGTVSDTDLRTSSKTDLTDSVVGSESAANVLRPVAGGFDGSVPTTSAPSFSLGAPVASSTTFEPSSSKFSFGVVNSKPALGTSFGIPSTSTSTLSTQSLFSAPSISGAFFAPSDALKPPVTGTTNPNLFIFGAAPATKSDADKTPASEATKPNLFAFGAPPAITSDATGKAPASETTKPSTFIFGLPPATKSDAAVKAPASEATKPNPFMFGTSTASKPDVVDKAPSTSVPSLFAFNQPVAGDVKPASNSSVFAFGQSSSNTASNNPFNFGSSTSSTVTNAGAFGSSASQPVSVPVFGSSAMPASTAPSFNFSGGASSNPTGIFTFGAKNDTLAKSGSVPTFGSLGKRPSTNDDSGIKRGRSSSEDMQMQDAEPSSSVPKQPFVFNQIPTGFGGFNAASAAPNTGLFGSKPANPAPVFGAPSAGPGFSFTGPQPSMPAPSFGPAPVAPQTGIPSFSFSGQQPSVPAPAFGNQNIPNLANGATNTGLAFGSSGPMTSVPPSFNFGVAPTINFTGNNSNPAGNMTFNVPPSTVASIPGRTYKKAVRRTQRN